MRTSFSGFGSSIILFLLMAKEMLMSSVTILRFGFVFLASIFNWLLCLAKDAMSSPSRTYIYKINIVNIIFQIFISIVTLYFPSVLIFFVGGISSNFLTIDGLLQGSPVYLLISRNLLLRLVMILPYCTNNTSTSSLWYEYFRVKWIPNKWIFLKDGLSNPGVLLFCRLNCVNAHYSSYPGIKMSCCCWTEIPCVEHISIHC